MASLHVLKGTTPGQRIELEDDRIVMGRNPDCQVVISGTAVSRAHGHILRVDGKYYIEDLASRNKTYINNQEINPREKVLLKDNDRIKNCDFLCTFHEAPVKKPLPKDLQPDEPEPPEEQGSSTTVEAAVSSVGSHLILETQPADKLKALLDITTNLSKTLQLDALMPKIGDSLFQLYKQADRCFIILQDEATKRLIPKMIKTRRPNDETNARFSRRIVNQCLENVQALLSDDAASDSRFAMSQSIADFRIRSVMCAPLWTQDGKGFGVIQLDTQDRSKKFTQDELKLLLGVAAQASVALENAKMHETLVTRERMRRDLELAREVQRGFLPSKEPEVAGYEFFMYYEAAQEVGGDYYDFVNLPEKRLAMMLGDVAGKGVPAALMMAKISSDARFCVLTEPSVAAAITKLNDSMHRSNTTERFVTLLAAVLDPATHSVTLVNAGHPSPLLYRRSDSSKIEDAVPNHVAGLPVGVIDGWEYTSFQLQLQPGDCIVAFSDGVTDSMDTNGRQLHLTGMINALRGGDLSPREVGDRIVRAVRQHSQGRGTPHDDVTLVCFGRTN